MAIPILYWMIECKGCGRRRVVHDSYLEFTGTSEPASAPGDGYSGRPLNERYGCCGRCTEGMRAVGSIFSPDDTQMWRHDPHEPVDMNQEQIDEWSRLIREAGLD